MRIVPSWLYASAAMLFLWSGLAFTPSAKADDHAKYYALNPVWQGGRLAHLSKYIGTENNLAVLDDPYVADSMKLVLGEDSTAVRERLLSSPGVIEYHLFFIVLRGSLPAKENHTEAATLIVNLTNGGLYAGLQTGGKTVVFGNHGPDEINPDYGELPWPLLFWVKQQTLQHIGWVPPKENFEWKFKTPQEKSK